MCLFLGNLSISQHDDVAARITALLQISAVQQLSLLEITRSILPASVTSGNVFCPYIGVFGLGQILCKTDNVHLRTK